LNATGKRYVSSKLRKTAVLLKNKRIAPHIPETKRFNMRTLNDMLDKYRMVYVKPVNGLKGIGVMRVEQTGNRYELRKGTSTNVFKDIHALYRSLRKQTRKKPYLVQKGIRMIRYQGRPFDFRIMVQKNEKRNWEASGIVGRVAPPNRIVTNRSQGGKCLSATTLLRPHMEKSKIPTYLASLFGLSRSIARQFQQSYPRVRQLGVDIAVSGDLKPWILEVNTNPAITPFVKLGDKQMVRRIIRLRRLNG